MAPNSGQEKLTKPYNPQETEGRIYGLWEKSGYFQPQADPPRADNPDNLPADKTRIESGLNADGNQRESASYPRKSAFTIIMPPPNANGHLHAGHALFITLEDIMTRYKRMQGYQTLWLPGTDHAGFETQIVFERQLEKEVRSRFDFSREELYAAIMKFTLEHQGNAENGLRALGASCDWSREKFSLDPSIIKTVYGTFKQLADDGLVYRGSRIVNWCTKHQTSLSDLETEAEVRTDKLYYMQYGPFVIATARPETKFGDKYVVMHPDDKRYAQYQDHQQIELDWLEGKITATVIKDEAIDMTFGTGVMTITPWHDAADFDIAKRHDLSGQEIIDKNGRLTEAAGEFKGLKIEEARTKVVERLKELGLLVKEEAYEHTITKCYKCGRILEPRIMPQWFVKMAPLAKPAIEAVQQGQIKIIPDWQEKVYFNWLNDIRDWNISRQIAWGIPIPAKICSTCDYGVVDLDNQEIACPHCQAPLITDPDTFDTWFSSGQWPFATLGFPDNSDFKTFYPTDVMETGSDLIFFWVARMIMLGLYRTGQVPFKTVYFHGMVLDAKNQKMSKSKGNVINPIDIGTKFGTDALRMALIVGNTPGTNMALAEDKIKGYKNFANKVWNISRFILDNAKRLGVTAERKADQTDGLITEFNQLAIEVTGDLDNFRFHLAAEKIYHYVWHRLADEIIEESKAVLAEPSEVARARAIVLQQLLADSLKLLHPFMPFVTEEIWQIAQFDTNKLLMVSAWPIND